MAATYRRNLFELLVLGIPTPPGSTMAASYQFQKAYGESGFTTATVEVTRSREAAPRPKSGSAEREEASSRGELLAFVAGSGDGRGGMGRGPGGSGPTWCSSQGAWAAGVP